MSNSRRNLGFGKKDFPRIKGENDKVHEAKNEKRIISVEKT